MKIISKYTARPSAGEKHGGVSKTEKAGYIPPKKMVESMITAGMRLKVFRAGQYDLEEGQEDDGEFMDPTREPGFDLADATQFQNYLKERAKKKPYRGEASTTPEPVKMDSGASPQEVKSPGGA